MHFHLYVLTTVLNTTLEKTFFRTTEEVSEEEKKQEAKHAGMTHTWPYQTENVCGKPPS